MNPPAILRWKDGREQRTSYGVGHTIIVPSAAADGRYLETEFKVQPHAAELTEADPLVFLEDETKDQTEAMRRAMEEQRLRFNEFIRRGLGDE